MKNSYEKLATSPNEPTPTAKCSLGKIVLWLYITIAGVLAFWLIYIYHPESAPNYLSRPISYSGEDVSARACVNLVPEHDETNTYDATKIAAWAVTNAWQDAFTMSTNTYVNFADPENMLFLYVTEREGDCRCPNDCPHLLAALFDAFKLQGSVPVNQCVSGQDTKGNKLSFIWGTNPLSQEERVCGVHTTMDVCVSVDTQLESERH